MKGIRDCLFDMFNSNRVNLILATHYDLVALKIIRDYIKEFLKDKTVFVSFNRFKPFKNVNEFHSHRDFIGKKIDCVIVIGSLSANDDEKIRFIMNDPSIDKVIWLGCTYRNGLFRDMYEKSIEDKNLCGSFFLRWDLYIREFPNESKSIYRMRSTCPADEWDTRYNLNWR